LTLSHFSGLLPSIFKQK
jgi:hypothetical protein